MPNWCENKIIVVGKKDIIDNLTAQMKKIHEEDSNAGFFEHYIPTPPELLNVESPNRDEISAKKFSNKYGATDWYQWRIDNWGTKWDISHISYVNSFEDYDKFGVQINCDTAWAPPENGLQKLSEIFKDTYFYCEFTEPGMGFQGYASFMNGQSVGAETVDYYMKVDDLMCNFEYLYEEAIESTKESN